MLKTIYVPLHDNTTGKVAHTVTMRSDWSKGDWGLLQRLFPNTYIRTVRTKTPIRFVGDSYHHMDFVSLSHKKLI